MKGDCVVKCFLRSSLGEPFRSLVDFSREEALEVGETRLLELWLRGSSLTSINSDGLRVPAKGEATVWCEGLGESRTKEFEINSA